MSDARALRRASGTLGLYATFGCLGYLLTGLGAILPELREERGLPRGEVALYPSAFALGLVIVGLAGHWAAARLGRLGLPAALTALVTGAGVMAVGGGRLGAGLGALILGLGGAGLVQLVPAALRAMYGGGGPEGAAHEAGEYQSRGREGGGHESGAHESRGREGDGTVQIGVANAVSSAASVLSPILIGASLAHGLGWRAAFAIPPLAVAAVLILAGRPATAGPAKTAPSGAGPRRTAPPAFRRRWFDLVLAVGVEFCMVFWAADFLGDVKGLGSGAAATLSAAFVLGMAAGRAAAGPAVRHGGRPDRLLALAALVGMTGFAVLWTAPAPLAVVGLLVTGLGVALLYPVILGQALAAWPEQPIRAAARCALASGVAIGTAPLVLGTLADLTTLRAAVFVAPALLLILLARCARRLGTGLAALPETSPGR